MKLLVKNSHLKYLPLIFGATSIPQFTQDITSIEYSESELISENANMNLNTVRYFEAISFNETAKSIMLESHLESLYKNWNLQTMFLSNVDQIINNPSFQEIVNNGTNAIPFILKKINKEPSVLVWALNIITNQNVSDGNRITVSEACKRWYKWGQEQKLV